VVKPALQHRLSEAMEWHPTAFPIRIQPRSYLGQRCCALVIHTAQLNASELVDVVKPVALHGWGHVRKLLLLLYAALRNILTNPIKGGKKISRHVPSRGHPNGTPTRGEKEGAKRPISTNTIPTRRPAYLKERRPTMGVFLDTARITT